MINGDINVIYDSLNESFDELYTEYYSFFMSKNKYKSVVIKEINKIKNNTINNYEKYLIKILKNKSIYIMKKLLTDDIKAKKIISNYILCMFKNVTDYQSANKCIMKLNKFMNLYDYDISYDLLIDLLKTNDILRGILKIIFEHNKNLILNGKCNELYKDSFIISLVETYAEINGFEIKSSDYVLNSELIGQDLYGLYLNEMLNYPLLTREEQVQLGNILKNNDKNSIEYIKAKEKLVNSNLRLVVSISKRYLDHGMSFQDLVQEGNVGLLIAIDRFDVDRGVKFSTYATWWIRSAITRAITDKGRMIRLPVYLVEKLVTYNREVSILSKKLNRDLTDEEIEKYLGYSKQKITKYNLLNQKISSLNELINNDEDDEMMNLVAISEERVDEEAIKKISNEEFQEAIKQAFSKDNEKRTLYILQRRFGLDGEEPETLIELGKRLGITRERVRQIEARALIKIRNSKKLSELFASFTDNPDQVKKLIKKTN